MKDVKKNNANTDKVLPYGNLNNNFKLNKQRDLHVSNGVSNKQANQASRIKVLKNLNKEAKGIMKLAGKKVLYFKKKMKKNESNLKDDQFIFKKVINKADLIKLISQKTDFTQLSIVKVINSMIDVIKISLRNNSIVKLIGFCSFIPKLRAARIARNPKKPDQIIKIPPRQVVAIKSSLHLLKT